MFSDPVCNDKNYNNNDNNNNNYNHNSNTSHNNHKGARKWKSIRSRLDGVGSCCWIFK